MDTDPDSFFDLPESLIIHIQTSQRSYQDQSVSTRHKMGLVVCVCVCVCVCVGGGGGGGGGGGERMVYKI